MHLFWLPQLLRGQGNKLLLQGNIPPVRPMREAGQPLPGATKPQCSPHSELSSGSMGKSTCIGFVLQDPNRILISFVPLIVVQLGGGKELAGRWVGEASFKSTACQNPGEVITGKFRLFL